MTGKQFHEINQRVFAAPEKLGFVRKGSKSHWTLKTSNERYIELYIRMDQRGWLAEYGSSFVYEYDVKVDGHFISPYRDQLRLHELLEYDSGLLSRASEILTQFALKLPAPDSSDDYYPSLVGPWTEPKVAANAGRWYMFYDEQDLIDWHKSTEHALRIALVQLATNDSHHSGKTHKPQKAHIDVDLESGESSLHIDGK
jgi:hypothetical protein